MDKIQNIFCLIIGDNLSRSSEFDIEKMSLDEWNSICEIAGFNNLLPLLYYNLKKNKIHIPLPIESKLRNDYLGYSGNDLKRKNQLLEIINIFNDNGIEHILLKGSHLAEKVYKNSSLRQMCDIDILIRKSDYVKIYKLLEKFKYTSSNPHHFDSELSSNKHYPPLIRDGFLPIELHWNINGCYNYDNIESIWARAENVTIGNLKTKVLCPEDLLLHISIHKGCDDKFISSLIILNDIKEICSHYTINWDRLASLACSKDGWDNTKCLFSSLYLSHKLLGVDVPEHLLKKIQPSDFNNLCENLLLTQFFTMIKADNFTYNAVNALTKIRRNNPLLIFEYLISPRKICLIYKKQYSWRILPWLYYKRITSKSGYLFKALAGIFKNNDVKKLYAASDASSKIEEWLKN